MTSPSRERQAVSKLLRVARLRAEEQSRKIAGLKSAHAASDESLRRLDETVRREEIAARDAPPGQLLAFLEGAAQKRAAITATRDRLALELSAARAAIEDAFGEMKKFEHLAERLELAAADRQLKKDAADVEAAALARYHRAEKR